MCVSVCVCVFAYVGGFFGFVTFRVLAYNSEILHPSLAFFVSPLKILMPRVRNPRRPCALQR